MQGPTDRMVFGVSPLSQRVLAKWALETFMESRALGGAGGGGGRVEIDDRAAERLRRANPDPERTYPEAGVSPIEYRIDCRRCVRCICEGTQGAHRPHSDGTAGEHLQIWI